MKKEILDYYASGIEAVRLKNDPLEKIRTQEIISRHLSKAPLKILDVGGGAGVYSFWLKHLGHEVHLVDPSPVNIENVKQTEKDSEIKLDSVAEGRAEKLFYEDQRFDLVLLLGPLYHLTERADRIKALNEARRVLKKEGKVIAAAITRFASMLDGFFRDLVADPNFVSIMHQDLQNGQHRNPTNNLEYFTTAFFHHPDELKSELNESGFNDSEVLPVESFGWLLPSYRNLSDVPDVKFRMCNVVNYAFFGVNASNELTINNSSLASQVIAKAKANNAKVFMSINDGSGDGKTNFKNMASTSGGRNLFIKDVMAKVRQFGFDGVDSCAVHFANPDA